MVVKSIDHYRELIPQAVVWLHSVQQYCFDHGRALTESEMQDALSVGVERPENIRLLTVHSIARPKNPALLQAAIETGLLGETAAARAVGYGIEVLEGHATRRLLRHEFRHVYQFEQAGALEPFVSAYVDSVILSGYNDSVFEQDARAYEIPD